MSLTPLWIFSHSLFSSHMSGCYGANNRDFQFGNHNLLSNMHVPVVWHFDSQEIKIYER